MLPVVSVNNRPTHPALGVCLQFNTHMCRCQGSTGGLWPCKRRFMGTRPTPVCSSAVSSRNQRLTSILKPTDHLKFHMEPTSSWGGSWIPCWDDLPREVASTISALFIRREEKEDTGGEPVRGSERPRVPRIRLPLLGMTQPQNISLQAKHGPRQHSPTSPLGFFNYSLD